MDLISKIANDFVINSIDDQCPEHEKVINSVKAKLYNIDNLSDKIKYFYTKEKNKKAISVQNINIISMITLLAGLVTLITFIFINLKQ